MRTQRRSFKQKHALTAIVKFGPDQWQCSMLLTHGGFTGADLTSALLTRVDLTFATVREVVLRNAKMSQMDLIQLDFTGADFTGLRAAANWFLVTCPDGSTQGEQDTIPCGLNN